MLSGGREDEAAVSAEHALAPEAIVSFAGTPDHDSVRQLALSIGRLAEQNDLIRVEFESQGCALPDLAYFQWVAFFGWMQRFALSNRARAVLRGPIDLASCVVFLAFERRTATCAGSICLGAAFGDYIGLDFRHIVDQGEEPGAQVFRSDISEGVFDLIRLRTKMSREQIVEYNRTKVHVAGTALLELGLCTDLEDAPA